MLARPRLEEWRTIYVDGDAHLVGFVYGHPKLRDGARAVTSRVCWMSLDRSVARTESRLYALGSAGIGPLPDDWAYAVELFLMVVWGTTRSPEP
jgi:hypothetical protein